MLNMSFHKFPAVSFTKVGNCCYEFLVLVSNSNREHGVGDNTV